ncbi:hypothetical protein LT330_009103 [Penicillium expansum]|uniref:Uncharacterized protein n=1 Tax=Penicillium expansum TaxID=27334 RepID=A0A0A2JIP1_PENEN|nr:hypothetical protein PEX2_108090 [Penicillium expansum]KAK4865670.1 hypothetical protein LT330_009103 [Penicillium expansum]KGO41707.1 hypothetical protein PEXP_089190 [Penicillium expansum]KGO52150.1 hypothetical protein PEX2_108090 [Penicillium expansum]
MPMASMDALGAFTHMKDNIPAWITRVSELATHTHKRHDEYSDAYRRHVNFKPRRRKNSSVCSIHTNDLVPIAQRKVPSPEPVAVETPQDAPEQSQRSGRKRTIDEAPSVESDEAYNMLVSTRHNIIIEYDGHTQQTLETIVRDIGVARNNLRRGQMSLMPRTGLRSGLLSKGMMNMPSGLGQTGPLSCVRSTRTTSGVVGISGTSTLRKDSPFDFADKQLELAHSLCETAAYQVLRSGDCGTELDGVEEKFKMLLEGAINEVDRLMAEKKQQEEHEQKQQEGTAEGPPKPPPTPSAARLAMVAAIAANKPSMTTGGAIEVDDNSSLSAESIDISAFRSSRIRV